MVKGFFSRRGEPMVSVVVGGSGGRQVEVDAVVDTGFSDYLTLPIEIIEALELPIMDNIWIQLADGSHSAVDVYDARIRLEDEWIGANVQPAQTTPLVGMKALAGKRFCVEAVPDGLIEIDDID